MAIAEQAVGPGASAAGEPGAHPISPGQERWRSFRMGLWVGWQNESNWADPWLFFIYTVAKPVASSLILLVMYMVVAGADTTTPLFAYIFLGNTFYTYISVVAVFTGWIIVEDREFFRILKFVALSPVRYFWYMAGRAASRTIIATMSVVILLTFGIVVLRLPVRLSTLRWEIFLPGLVLGLLACFATGLVLAAFLLVTPRKGPAAMEAVAGLIFLVAGVIFPVDILPAWLRTISFGMPFTYWMETIRRGLVGGGLNQSLAGLSDGVILLRLAVMTAIALAGSFLIFRWGERVTRQKGLIDAVHEW